MIVTLLAALLLARATVEVLPPTSPLNHPAPAGAQCAHAEVHPAEAAGKARPQRLGELPPANHYRAVFRTLGGCIEPQIVRYGIGASPMKGSSAHE